MQDKQIVRLIGKMPTLAALAYHRASGRKPAQPNQNLGYAEVGAVGVGAVGVGAGPWELGPWGRAEETTGWWAGVLIRARRGPAASPLNRFHTSHRSSPFPPCSPPTHTHPQNFLYMLDAGSHPGYRPNPRLARALDILFILHAEHELNCRWG